MNYDPNKGGDTYLYPIERLQLCVIDPEIANVDQSLTIWSKHFAIGLKFAMSEGALPEQLMPSA